MIKVSKTIEIIRIKACFSARALIVSHLGKNPINGGSPPRLKKFIINVILINLLSFIWLINCLRKKMLKFISIEIIISNIRV